MQIVRSLSFVLPSSGLPPTEFRLFSPGWNVTEKGKFLFDRAAAQAVMANDAAWGVDRAIDLEHQMLEPGSSPDPTAKDARGWCKLQLRSDGSLWAVDVKWTPDGAERLARKAQRYISPAFEADPATKRITKIINVAITSIPATHQTPALVAASAVRKGMDPKLVMKALEALQGGNSDDAMEILKALIASAAGAEADADGEGDPAEAGEDPSAQMASEEKPREVESHDDGDMDADDEAEGRANYASEEQPPESHREPPLAGDEDGEQPGKPKKPSKASLTADAAALSRVLRLTGAKSFADAAERVADFRASHLELEGERQKIAKERASLESAERRKLCAELVTLGAEFPATVWADLKSRTPKKRWLKMSIEDLRAHVQEQRTVRSPRRSSATGDAPRLPVGESVNLSAAELAMCEEMGCDPKTYVQLKGYRNMNEQDHIRLVRSQTAHNGGN